MNKEAYEIVERLVSYTWWKSMNQLRTMVKDVLIERGFKEELRNFKLVRASNGDVIIYTRGRDLYEENRNSTEASGG